MTRTRAGLSGIPCVSGVPCFLNTDTVKRLLLSCVAALLFASLLSQELRLDLVAVRWVDIVATDGGWRSLDEAEGWAYTVPDTVCQVGFVVGVYRDAIVLTDSYFPDGTVGYCVKIPLGAVVDVVPLSVGGRGRNR